MKNPFLLIRNKTNKSVAPTCFTCGYKSLKTAKINSCKHSKIERSIYGTYCVSEIEYALSLGYKLVKIFSILNYKESYPILHQFVTLLGFEKLKASGYPSDISDKNEFCNYLNQKMKFAQIGLELKPTMLNYNNKKREFAKLALNSFLGKFSQCNNKSFHKLVSSENEIAKYFYSKTFEIKSIFCYNQYFCHIEVDRKRKTLIKPNLSANCVIGAQIVAFARQFMHEKMMELEGLGATIYYSDTDNLIFALKKWQQNPLSISPAFGDFKYEIPKESTILSYFSLGPKNYAIQFKDVNGSYGNIVKLRGMTLTNAFNENIIDTEVYNNFLNNALKKKHIQIGIPQVRFRSSKVTKTKAFVFQKTFFSNAIQSKRIVNKSSNNFLTYPFGYHQT